MNEISLVLHGMCRQDKATSVVTSTMESANPVVNLSVGRLVSTNGDSKFPISTQRVVDGHIEIAYRDSELSVFLHGICTFLNANCLPYLALIHMFR